MENVINPKYAPVYVDSATKAMDQVPDDDADKWSGNRLEDDLLFGNSFNPVGTPQPKRERRKAAVFVSMSEPKLPQCPKKTMEELELEEIKQLQKEAKKALEQSRGSFQCQGKSSGPIVVMGSRPTPQAMEFNFHPKDCGRSRPGSATKKEGTTAKKPLISELESKSFKFCLDECFKSKFSTFSKITSTTEAFEKYQKATPSQFRSNPGSFIKKWKVKACTADQSSSSSGTDDSSRPYTAELTVPHTSNLLTKGRSQSITVKSAVKEEEVVAQMKKYRFKSVPPKKSVLTEPQSPVLVTAERSRKRKAQEMSGDTTDANEKERSATTFHARPMPNFTKIIGLPPKKKAPLTEPESPPLAVKRRRLHTEEDQEEEEGESHVIKPAPVPNMDKYFQPQLPHKRVATQPFSFEERDKNKPTRETFVEMMLCKEKKAPFKAQALPDFGLLPDLPLKAPYQSTKPKPFVFRTDIRGEQCSIKLQRMLEEEIKRVKEDAEFRATPASVLQKEPFIPQIPPRPLQTINNFSLHSEMRSRQRRKYNERCAAEKREKMAENLRRQALRAVEEKKELAKYRKKLVHKAQPISKLQYDPVIIQPDRPITLPRSPHFRTDDRLRARV